MYISQITTISENQMIRFHITKPAQEFYFSDTGPEPQIAFSFPDHFLKIGVLDGLTSPSPLAQIRKSENVSYWPVYPVQCIDPQEDTGGFRR